MEIDGTAWCGVCETDTARAAENVCAACGCSTPLCPECRQPLGLVVDDDDETHLNWSCEACGIDYARRTFPIPRSVADQQRKYIKDRDFSERQADERARLQAWNEAMRRCNLRIVERVGDGRANLDT